MKIDEAILRFFRDEIGGILITDPEGDVLYCDEQTAFIRDGETNWKAACPPARPEQKKEIWDLMDAKSQTSYMVITSTFTDEEGMKQIHFLADTSLYTGLFRDISDYSRRMKMEKDRDGLTGLYNRSKFLEMKQTVFEKQKAIGICFMDINNLKRTNDECGHETGDRLIKKAAESLKRIEARNIMPFRVGGDEFVVVAIHVNREEAEDIRQRWEEELAELNRKDDGIYCSVACGFAFGEKGYVLDDVLEEADKKMYENKRKMKEKS